MGYLKVRVNDSFSDVLQKNLQKAGPRAAHALAVQVARDTNPFVPASGAPAGMYNKAQVVENRIIYPGPYARYLYKGKVMVYKDPPYKIKRPDGKIVFTHYGQKKVPIDKNLHISTAHHERATAKWFEESKKQNLDKWARVAGEAMERELE